MIFKTFIIGMVLVGIAVILTELHRYMVYSEELERDIVYAIYVRGLLWKEAADRMNYSYQRLYQKHQDILKRLEVVLLD